MSGFLHFKLWFSVMVSVVKRCFFEDVYVTTNKKRPQICESKGILRGVGGGKGNVEMLILISKLKIRNFKCLMNWI